MAHYYLSIDYRPTDYMHISYILFRSWNISIMQYNLKLSYLKPALESIKWRKKMKETKGFEKNNFSTFFKLLSWIPMIKLLIYRETKRFTIFLISYFVYTCITIKIYNTLFNNDHVSHIIIWLRKQYSYTACNYRSIPFLEAHVC